MSYWAYFSSMSAFEACLTLNQGTSSHISTLAIPLACVIELLILLFYFPYQHFYPFIKKFCSPDGGQTTPLNIGSLYLY
jgi:hypothetical protein